MHIGYLQYILGSVKLLSINWNINVFGGLSVSYVVVIYVTLELGSYIFPVMYSWSNNSVASSIFFIE
jgi:hypothetical protein